MPAFLALALALMLLGAINLCGFASCAEPDRGWGWNARTAGTVGYLAASVVMIAVPAAVVRWHVSRTFRWVVALAAATVVVGVTATVATLRGFGG